jgi:hypothetical protein
MDAGNGLWEASDRLLYTSSRSPIFDEYQLGRLGYRKPFSRGMLFSSSFRNNIVQRKPIIPSPAEQAPHRPQSKHFQQPIDRPQLSLLEFQRVAFWAFMPNPQQMGNPAGPSLVRKVHIDCSSRATSATR